MYLFIYVFFSIFGSSISISTILIIIRNPQDLILKNPKGSLKEAVTLGSIREVRV